MVSNIILLSPSLGIQSLAVLSQTGAGLLVRAHAVVLHHTVQEGNKVLVLPCVATHPAHVGAGPVVRVTLGQVRIENIIFQREIKLEMILHFTGGN